MRQLAVATMDAGTPRSGVCAFEFFPFPAIPEHAIQLSGVLDLVYWIEISVLENATQALLSSIPPSTLRFWLHNIWNGIGKG